MASPFPLVDGSPLVGGIARVIELSVDPDMSKGQTDHYERN